MKLAADVLIAFVAGAHLWFLVLEMFLWQRPLGLKTFHNSPEKAATTAVLAANQGLYNGFLAAGLLLGFVLPQNVGHAFHLYFLVCVILAGCYGAWSVSRRIFFVQALPALIALGLGSL